ncbi:MAG: hypothetical protein IPG18_08615 [Saprospiraceae bacterium]|nr:hypothetical protein [Saprospiraceae bacterium]
MKAVIDARKKHIGKLCFFDNVYMYDTSAIPQMTENADSCTEQKGVVMTTIARNDHEGSGENTLTALIA